MISKFNQPGFWGCLRTAYSLHLVLALTLLVTSGPPAAAYQAAAGTQDQYGTDSAGRSQKADPSSDDDLREPPGLVYFAGTVERMIRGSAIIDLGEAHSLQTGSLLCLFRAENSQFRPLGTLEVVTSYPTWSQCSAAGGIHPEPGDIVLMIRTVGEIGTAGSYQDGFLTRQRILNGNRNGYSTMRNLDTAQALMKIRLQQPKWVQFEKRISGVIHSATLQESGARMLERLLNQINLFRRLHNEGYHVAECAGDQWKIVMDQLQGPPPSAGPKVLTSRTAEPAVSTKPEKESVPRLEIQNMVAQILFDRNPEEQAIASALCCALLQDISRNEPQWLIRELRNTQFPLLADDEQFRIDIALVLRKIREKRG